jgi:hypothetical protein
MAGLADRSRSGRAFFKHNRPDRLTTRLGSVTNQFRTLHAPLVVSLPPHPTPQLRFTPARAHLNEREG